MLSIRHLQASLRSGLISALLHRLRHHRSAGTMNANDGRARRCSGHLRRRIASSLPVLLAALALASCSVMRRPASRRLNDEIARIRAAGEPLTFEELRADRSAGDGADAASDYRAAAVLLADLDSGPLFDL